MCQGTLLLRDRGRGAWDVGRGTDGRACCGTDAAAQGLSEQDTQTRSRRHRECKQATCWENGFHLGEGEPGRPAQLTSPEEAAGRGGVTGPGREAQQSAPRLEPLTGVGTENQTRAKRNRTVGKNVFSSKHDTSLLPLPSSAGPGRHWGDRTVLSALCGRLAESAGGGGLGARVLKGTGRKCRPLAPAEVKPLGFRVSVSDPDTHCVLQPHPGTATVASPSQLERGQETPGTHSRSPTPVSEKADGRCAAGQCWGSPQATCAARNTTAAKAKSGE